MKGTVRPACSFETDQGPKDDQVATFPPVCFCAQMPQMHFYQPKQAAHIIIFGLVSDEWPMANVRTHFKKPFRPEPPESMTLRFAQLTRVSDCNSFPSLSCRKRRRRRLQKRNLLQRPSGFYCDLLFIMHTYAKVMLITVAFDDDGEREV